MRLAVPLSRRSEELARLVPPPVPGADRNDVGLAGRRAASAALDRGETHYTDRPGLPKLRAAVADRLADTHAWPTAAGDVVITCGVTEARFVALQRMLPNGTGTVWAVAHGDRIEGPARIRGARVVASDPGDGAGRTIVYVPADAAEGERNQALDRAAQRQWAVVYEMDRVDGDDAVLPERSGSRAHVYVIGDLAGPHGAAAWRVGFLATPPDAVGPLKEFKQALTLCTTNVSQWGVLALLEDAR